MSCKISLNDKFFAPRQKGNLSSTIPSALARCKETGRLDAFKLQWKEGSSEVCPHIYWDSDVAKVMEGMAYVYNEAPEIGKKLEELVELVISAQQEDGYLNTHFTVCDQDKRWTNLFNCHELYCAGHLIEAAVAHFNATGKRNFLDAMCSYTDYICDTFGKNGIPGVPGHEELELALCKLYRATGNERYLEQAKLFVDRRGTEPNYFVEKEGVEPVLLKNRQAHIPVREQTEAVGHSVRAVYLYSGVADVAALTGDKELMAVCEKLFENISQKKMYISGGIGSSQMGEAFGHDLDLLPERSYAESCAAIGLIFFASRMLKALEKSLYADVIERAIFNGAISGLSLSGDKFFYSNLLECHKGSLNNGHVSYERQPWYRTSCCPTSYCRFLPQLGNFCYRVDKHRLSVDIPVAATVTSDDYSAKITSDYPYNGKITVEITKGGTFELAFRIPQWCRNYAVNIDTDVECRIKNGYWRCRKNWQDGEKVEFILDMPVEKVFSAAPANFGKVAICRGPLVYCLEMPTDGKLSPFGVRIPLNAEFTLENLDELLPGTKGISCEALYGDLPEELYSTEKPLYHTEKITLVPYALWQNRGAAQMAVYLPFER